MSIGRIGRGMPKRFARATTPRRLALDWRQIALVLLALLLAYQVIVPFLMIIWTSLKTARPGEPEFVSFTFTLANYVRAFGNWSFWSATWDTLTFSVASTLVAFVLGAFVAWVVERTNTPLAQFIGLVLIGRIVVPGILIAISWILIASPNIGLLNQIVRDLTGIRNLFNIYSFCRHGLGAVDRNGAADLSSAFGLVPGDGSAARGGLDDDRRRHLADAPAHPPSPGAAGDAARRCCSSSSPRSRRSKCRC